mgnify:CR=1 FL=1
MWIFLPIGKILSWNRRTYPSDYHIKSKMRNAECRIGHFIANKELPAHYYLNFPAKHRHDDPCRNSRIQRFGAGRTGGNTYFLR